jgi:hypothetical protein
MTKLIFVLAALLVASTASAQTKDPLQEICTGFLNQGGASVGGDHARLCTCLVGETQKRLTRQEMEIYNKAATTGQEPPPAIMQKVVAIATLCLTQAR